ncbi:MAG: hypothetical protein QMD92_01295 [bacterium]|nr:hypothetical protein [bacterium]
MVKFTKIKELFLNNLGLKCISIALGVLLWIYVGNEEGTIKRFKIPITYEGINNGLHISYCSKNKVLITAQGKRENILSCQLSDFSLSLNLSQKSAGTYIYKLFPRKIVRPQNITIKAVYPEYIKIILKSKSVK